MQNTVLVVDDVADNITMLHAILKDHYKVQVANNGEKALKIVESENPPDLILLDIMMPDMDGYSVCESIKRNPKTADIPILFMSALSQVSSITTGFNLGAVDYITKPFHLDEVMMRVKVHLDLRNSKREIQSLLSRTLVGTIKVMSDVITLTNPQLTEMTAQLRKYFKGMSPFLNLTAGDLWEVELSIILSHIGCISLPSSLLEKKLSGVMLSDDMKMAYMKYPEHGFAMIEKIPRLENVAQIVRLHLVSPDRLPQGLPNVVVLGCQILSLLLSYHRFLERKFPSHIAIEKLRETKQYPSALIEALSNGETGTKFIVNDYVKTDDLKAGMVLVEPVFLNNGKMLIPKNTELTDSLIGVMINLKNMKQMEKPYFSVYRA